MADVPTWTNAGGLLLGVLFALTVVLSAVYLLELIGRRWAP